ncbi:MAG: hypothetical protein QM754_14170 [Tepidisphaeraceae bacterium]
MTTIKSESQKFQQKFGRPLPDLYLDICRFEDGLTDDKYSTMYGLGTYWGDDAEFPAYEGLLDVYERNVLDLGTEGFIEFGLRNGVEPWGLDGRTNCFVEADSNRRDIRQRFDSFEEWFRALFRL